MQLIKNSIKMLDDIKMLDHNIQNLTTTTTTEMPVLCRVEQERKHMEEMTYAYLAASYLQITCKNVPASSSPTMSAATPLTANTTLRKTTKTTKETNFVNATNNNVNDFAKTYINKNINIGSNFKIEYKINNYHNNKYNKNCNNNNDNNIFKIKYNKNNRKNSSCCQCSCEHKTHYEQHALLTRIYQKQQKQQKNHQVEEEKVQRHDKQPKTKAATVSSPTSEECVRRVLGTTANTLCNNKNYSYSKCCCCCYYYYYYYLCSSKKHDKLFQTHFSISLLNVKEEEMDEEEEYNIKSRRFSTNCLSAEKTNICKTTSAATTTRKSNLKSSMLDFRKRATVSYFESLYAASLLTQPKLTTKSLETTTRLCPTTTEIIIIKRKHLSTITTPQTLTIVKTEHELMPQQLHEGVDVKGVKEAEEICCMTKCNMSAKAKSILLKDVVEEKLLVMMVVVVVVAKIKESFKNVGNQIELKENLVFVVDHNDNDNDDYVDVDNEVVDSLKLNRRNTPQLVMPIEGNCSRLLMAVSSNKHKLKEVEEEQSGLLLQSVIKVWENEGDEVFKKNASLRLTKQITTKFNLNTKTLTATTTKTTINNTKLDNNNYNNNNHNNNVDVVASDSCFKEITSDIVNLRLQETHQQQQQQQQEKFKQDNLQSRKVHDEVAYVKDASTIFSNLLATIVFLIAGVATSRLNGSSRKSISSTWCNNISLKLVMLLMMTTTAYCWTGRQDAMTNCTFPARWEGSWFLSGYQQSIHIKGSQFSYRGKCLASDGNKYLIVDEKGCHRCLVIYEKHKNVLQYKESECEGDSMYMHQANPPSALAMRSVLLKDSQNAGGEHRGGAHPNIPSSELNTNTNTHPNVANGHSRLSSSDQFILRSNDDMNDYFCKGRETLQNLCDQIPGDALLYSLFRESAEPVKCPLRGPFVFTYNRGHGECKSPLSNIESCTEESRLLLSFQACPDVQGTESTVEELTCLATWKDGNSRYLVGLVSHHHAISNEERYRCFVYEKLSTLLGAPAIVSVSKDAEYKLAQSGDATCNGLDSAEVGSRIMSLRKPPLAERCDFPPWFKGPRHWHALMGNAVYNYHVDGSVHVIKPNGYMETRALCEQINKQTSTEMMAVVHYTTGCQSGFMCMMFYRRDTHVIEIQTGKPAARLEDACAPDHFDIMRMPFITLLASNPDPQICPMEGLYNLRGPIGPPYLATRHKRNHNNKSHGSHGHHHQQQQQQMHLQQGGEVDTIGHENMAYIGHKRHINSNLNYRNVEHSVDLTTRIRRAVDNQHHEIHLMPGNLVRSNHANGSSSRNADDDASLGPRSRRNAPPCITNYKAQRRLWVGCTDQNVIDVRPMCTDEGDEEYSCHGHWMENGTVYIIARHKGTKHGVCISYRPTEGNSAKLVIGDACYRGVESPPEHHLVANLSVFGKCGETGNGGIATARRDSTSCFILLGVAVFITFIGHCWQSMQHR